MGQITQNIGGARNFAQSHESVRWITCASAARTTEAFRGRVECFNNPANVCDFSQLEGHAESCISTPWLLGAFHQCQCGRRPREGCNSLFENLKAFRMPLESSSATTDYTRRGKMPQSDIQRRGSCISTCRRYAERVGSKTKSVAVRNGSRWGVASACGAVLGCASGACGHSPCSSRQEHRCGKVSGMSFG